MTFSLRVTRACVFGALAVSTLPRASLRAEFSFESLGAGTYSLLYSEDGSVAVSGSSYRWASVSWSGGGFSGWGLNGYQLVGMSADGSTLALVHEFGWGMYMYTESDGVVDFGNTPDSSSPYALAISRDGSTLLGQAAMSGTRVVRASRTDGLEVLGTLGGQNAWAGLLSDDGSVITGSSDTATDDSHAFRWTRASGMVDLGTLGGASSEARQLSADGSVVAGNASTAEEDVHVFRWSAEDGMRDLGTLGGDQGIPYQMTRDGSVIAGVSLDAEGTPRVFRWTEADGMRDIGPADELDYYSLGMSTDGQVLAGTYRDSNDKRRAFRWSTSEGWTDLGVDEVTGGVSMSQDGSVLAGAYKSGALNAASRAFIWTAVTGWKDAKVWVEALGGDTSYIESIDAIGSVRRFGDQVCMFALGWVDAGGYSLGFELKLDFPTSPILTKPAVVNTQVVVHEEKRADLGARVATDGGSPVTERGIIFDGTKVPCGDGTGDFSLRVSAALFGSSWHHYRAYATNAIGTDMSPYSDNFIAPPPPVLIWEDIGEPAVAGSQTVGSPDKLSVAAGGADMWGTRDQFRFGHEAVSGDVELAMEVSEISGPSAWSRSGVTVRKSLDPQSAHVTLIATVGNGVDLQWRSEDGGVTEHLTSASGVNPTPVFLRLMRQGSVFTAYRSPNGLVWDSIGQVTVSMPDDVQAGVIACAVSPSGQVQAEDYRYYSWSDSGNTSALRVQGDLDFGDVTVGSSQSRMVTLSNVGSDAVAVTSVELPDGFTSDMPAKLEAGESSEIAVVFSPDALGAYSGSMTLSAGALGVVGAIQVSGAGVAAVDPLTWTDVGDPGIPGYQSFRSTVAGYRISASGADMWGDFDHFRFGYAHASGDGELVVRVDTLDGPHPWSRVGPSIRASLDPDAPHVTLIATKDNGVDLQWRSVAGGSTSHLTSESGVNPAPVFLKLKRSGIQFVGYRSSDGTNWTEVGSVDVPMPARVEVGLIACATSDGSSMLTEVSNFASTFAPPKLSASIVVDGLEQTYDGLPKGVIVTTDPAGLSLKTTYDGVPQAPTEAGTYTVHLEIEDEQYAGSATRSLTIEKAPQNISFANLPNQAFGGSVLLDATASSGLPVVFSVISGPASLDGKTLHLDDVGQVGVRAAQAGDANFLEAAAIDQSFEIMPAQALVLINSLSSVFDGFPKAVTVDTEPANLPVEVLYDGSPSTPVAAGVYAVQARVTDVRYSGSATASLTVAKAAQTITFPPLPAEIQLNVDPIAIGATASSGLPVSVSVASGPGSIVDGSLVPGTAGSAVIRASQDGDANHLPAPVIEQTVRFVKATATVSLSNLTQTYDGAGKSVSATTNPADLPVRITYDGQESEPADAGSYVINATVEHETYAGTASGMLVIDKAPQTITFPALPTVIHLNADPIAIEATASSGLPVSVSIVAGPGSIAGGSLVPGTAGSTTIRASQNGDGNFLAAPALEQTVRFVEAVATVTLSGLTQTYDGSQKSVSATTNPANLPVRIKYDGQERAPTDAGSYTIDVTVEDETYGGAATGTLVIEKAIASIEILSLEQVADGTPKQVDVCTTPAGLPVAVTYDGAATMPTDAGQYLVVAVIDDANYSGEATANLTLGDLSRLMNLSARATVGVGDGIMIPGFVVGGSGSKRLLIRGIGPTLANDFGVGDALATTRLVLLQGSTIVLSNSGWDTAENADEIAATAQQVGAFPLASESGDSALLAELSPGAYTVQLTGLAGGTGVGLIELYDAGAADGAPRLVNISSRSWVGTGSQVAISGYVIGGNGERRLLIRGVGPTLQGDPFNMSGVLEDPRLSVTSATGPVTSNDNWGDEENAAEIKTIAEEVGAFPLIEGSKDAAILISLPPGVYTVTVSGVDGSTGIGLIEVYEVP